MYFNVCPLCGCHLDPGEKCDCSDEKARQERQLLELMEYDRKTMQYRLVVKKPAV